MLSIASFEKPLGENRSVPTFADSCFDTWPAAGGDTSPRRRKI
jgi:hypothetical protein